MTAVGFFAQTVTLGGGGTGATRAALLRAALLPLSMPADRGGG